MLLPLKVSQLDLLYIVLHCSAFSHLNSLVFSDVILYMYVHMHVYIDVLVDIFCE